MESSTAIIPSKGTAYDTSRATMNLLFSLTINYFAVQAEMVTVEISIDMSIPHDLPQLPFDI